MTRTHHRGIGLLLAVSLSLGWSAPVWASPAVSERQHPEDRPRVPAWKWGALGGSAGLTVAGIVIATVAGLRLRGPLRDDIREAAVQSTQDCFDPSTSMIVSCDADGAMLNVANDVDPNGATDLCEAGRTQPDPGSVTNAAVVRACERADTMIKLNRSGMVIAGVGVVATAVFTALILVPLRRNHRAAAALERRQPTMGFSPLPGGGLLGAGMRF